MFLNRIMCVRNNEKTGGACILQRPLSTILRDCDRLTNLDQVRIFNDIQMCVSKIIYQTTDSYSKYSFRQAYPWQAAGLRRI